MTKSDPILIAGWAVYLNVVNGFSLSMSYLLMHELMVHHNLQEQTFQPMQDPVTQWTQLALDCILCHFPVLLNPDLSPSEEAI